MKKRIVWKIIIITVAIILILIILQLYKVLNFSIDSNREVSQAFIENLTKVELENYCSSLYKVANGSSYCYTCWRDPTDLVKLNSSEQYNSRNFSNSHYYFIEKTNTNYIVNIKIYLALGRATRGGMFKGNFTINDNGTVIDRFFPKAGCI